MNLRTVLPVSLFVLTALPSGSPAQPTPVSLSRGGSPENVSISIARMAALTDSAERRRAINDFIARLRRTGGPITGDSTVTFVYDGPGLRVSVAGDLNGWDPSADQMTRLPGSSFFHLTRTVDPASRLEYKFVVDSSWGLDPLNPAEAEGGFGPNSEVRMPLYRSPADVLAREGISRGRIDTLPFASRILGRTHRVMVYCPPGYGSSGKKYPVIYVTDGGEYLSLGRMNVVIDNLIADGRIEPIIGVFMDPRTDPADPRSTRRMTDYALSDTFLDALTEELLPMLSQRYRIKAGPAHTCIMGASLGGLIATYAAFTRPQVFGLCAAQSPAYQWERDTLLTMIRNAPRKEFVMYLDTGTMHDAQEKARRLRDIMRAEGYSLTYGEYPEGHNWLNWRARLSTIVRTFWGIR